MIQIFITGGTFHKTYDEIIQNFRFSSVYVTKILKDARCTLNISIDELMMKDSLEMTADDVELIIDKCNNSKYKKIVIIHGTDRMCQNAKMINKKIKDKTIVLTGSIIPCGCINSDAPYNLSSALSFVQCLEPGVYICMNGKCEKFNLISKNYKTGYFVF